MAKGSLELSGPGLQMLRKLHKRVEDLTRVKELIAAAQSEEAIDLTKQGFVDEEDPYGRAWKKRKRETKKSRGRKVLSGETGQSGLKAGWHTSGVSGAGFRISPTVNYAIYHQSPRKRRKAIKVLGLGTVGQKELSTMTRPKRAMVPDTGRFPSKWRRPMHEAATETITDFLTG